MLKIGITGSIGSGKTTVCKIFESLGVPVYYADDRGKFLQQNNPEVRKQVRDAFGENMYDAEDNFDRAAMAEVVFKDPAKLKMLEGIVHPAVLKDFLDWIAQQNSPYIIKEAALLYEAGTYRDLYGMIAVSAPFETRMQRVLSRDKTTSKLVMERMNRQWPDEKKIAMADYVVNNDDKHLLLPQIMKLHNQFLEIANQVKS
jgi:dephospho-CoA kinase